MTDWARIAEVESREDFVQFVKALSEDFRRNGESWENQRLDRYLEALAAWVADMDGYYQNSGETAPRNVPWRFIAQVLLAATIYE